MLPGGNVTVVVTPTNATAATITNAPTTQQPVTAPPTTTAAPATVSPVNPFIKCRGTCKSTPGVWVTNPETPNYFDVPFDSSDVNRIRARADGRPVDSIDFAEAEGMLRVQSYATIGNLGARFPTLALVNVPVGTDFNSKAVPSSSLLGFDPKCLNQQADETGIPDDVWWWNNYTAMTGTAGSHAFSGDSYYQKFGGMHDQCNIYQADPCHYAPLLTPNKDRRPDEPQWSVDVDSCDITWNGLFTAESMLKMRNADGSPTFTRVGDNKVSGTFYSEVIKPATWDSPTDGTSMLASPSTVYAAIGTEVRSVVTEAATGAASSISSDAKVFSWVDETGQQNYGYNINVYPGDSLPNETQVVQVEVVSYNFDVASCAECSFAQTGCSRAELEVTPVPTTAVPTTTTSAPATTNATATTAPNVTLPPLPPANGTNVTKRAMAAQQTSGSCRDNTVLQFSLGPAATNECAGTNATWTTTGYAGVSDAVNSLGQSCPVMQNITLRWIAPGNNSARSLGPISGTFTLRLTLRNGRQVILAVSQSNFVSQVSTTPEAFLSFDLCRTSAYWPVYDPSGTSAPTRPFRIPDGDLNPTSIDNTGSAKPEAITESESAPAEADQSIPMTSVASGENRLLKLCQNLNDRTYGPTEWAFLTVNLPNNGSNTLVNATINHLKLIYRRPASRGPSTFFLIPPRGSEDAVPTADTVFNWQRDASFLNFRNVVGTLNPGLEFGFLFTPGAVLMPADLNQVEVIVEASVYVVDTNRDVIVRERLVIDKSITVLTRGDDNQTKAFDRHVDPIVEQTNNFAIMVSLALAGGVVILGGLAIYFDDNAKKAVKNLLGKAQDTVKPPAPSDAKTPAKPGAPTTAAAKKAASAMPKAPAPVPKKPEVESPRVDQASEVRSEVTASDVADRAEF